MQTFQIYPLRVAYKKTRKKSKYSPEAEALAKVLSEKWSGKDFFPKLKSKTMKPLIAALILFSSCSTMRTQQTVPAEAKHVQMQIVLKKRGSYAFFKEGFKLNDKYWYLDRNRAYPLPENWLVWESKVIKP